MFFCLIRSNTFWTSLLVDLRVEAVGRAVVAMGLSRIGFRFGIRGSHKDDAPALNHRTQGHRVSTYATQAKVQAVRSGVSASFAGQPPHWGAADWVGVRSASAWRLPVDWACGRRTF